MLDLQELLVQQEIKVRQVELLVALDQRAQLVPQDHKAYKVFKVQPDLQVQLVPQELIQLFQVQLDQQVQLVIRAQRVQPGQLEPSQIQ
jgi:tryptophan 2,3-dioxygenase